MQTFDSDGVQIAYLDSGEHGAPAILLIHGFASSTAVNWVGTGWVKELVAAGFRVVSMDNRGHGQSEKLHDEARYGAPIMADDASRLLEHLAISRAHVMGYSMGARIAVFLAIRHPDQVASTTIAGMGHNMIRGIGGARPIAAALLAPSIDDVHDAAARSFRAFAEQTGSDLKALAACILSAREPITADMVAGLNVPVLIAVGTEDVVAGAAQPLADLIKDAQVLDIKGRDHMKAVGDPQYKAGVLAFLAQQPLP